jgi:conjugative transfer signal peptidase TraF
MRDGPGQIDHISGRRRNVAAIFAVAVIAAGVMSAVGLDTGLRINLTPSEPLGLWRIITLNSSVTDGELVFICPPQSDAMRKARERGYLRYGFCPGDYAPLIKTVVATAGQVIAIDDEVHIGDVVLPHSTVSRRDGKGRPLTAFPGGIVPPAAVFLHSNFKASFDSRYFGPVPVSGVLGLAKEVWTYAP